MKNKIRFDKRLFESLFSLGLAQFFNYLSPLISFPLLLKEFGIEKYGIISTSFVLALLFCSFADFGFNISGVKFIAQNREKTSNIFYSIFFLKLIFSIFLLTTFYILVENYESYKEYEIIFIFSSGMIIARIFNCDWFFQGKEKMRFIAITNFISNCIYIIGILVLININLGFKYVTLFRSLGLLLGSIISFISAIYFFNLKFIFNKKDIIYFANKGSFVFVSTIASNIFQNTPALLVKSLFSYEIVGVYSSIEKMVSFGKQMVMIINQMFHPRLAIYFSKNVSDFIRLWKKSSLVSIIAAVGILFLLFMSKSLIFNYFSELKTFKFTTSLYYLMTLLIVTYTLVNALGLNGLLIINKTRNLALSQIYPLIIYVILAITFIKMKIEDILIVALLLFIIDILIVGIRAFMFKSALGIRIPFKYKITSKKTY
ncbi:oligosaccharide flippase family protein [Aquimarina sp. 2201CG14-23]|uniref:oligosaccharide flippase family protein n=1 Tax=Aquimarina mycalae TaxID=3040073 RepID=UPI00247817E1|nr:oligosaccharide flippase family protein [Aquimarina sp. 2201CG14-23]MDH7446363.1 oligosaccharide flippase family protein [Aquimarina sp. 2201CG14-23]